MLPRVRTTTLFRFTIRNGSNGRLNINPGILTDFDVDSLFPTMWDAARRNGRLSLGVEHGECQWHPRRDADDRRIGSTPGFFFYGDQIPVDRRSDRGTARQSVGLGGRSRATSATSRVSAAIGLSPGAETDLWVAVIAAENDAAFADAADAAS